MNKIIIKANPNLFDFNIHELLQYKNLIFIFAKRNFKTRYKQTILGFAWLFLSPLFTVFAYTVVFGNLAGLSTGGIPKPLFYLTGNILWSFFSNCVIQTSKCFLDNAPLFSKIYFPRLTVPASIILTNLIDFLIQFLLFFIMELLYMEKGFKPFISTQFFFCPLILIQLMLLSMGLGMIISSATIKYRDFTVLTGFGMQLWLYISPVIYTADTIPDKYFSYFMLNPVAPAFLIFRKALLGTGIIPLHYWSISWISTITIFTFGILFFNKVEKYFVDTI